MHNRYCCRCLKTTSHIMGQGKQTCTVCGVLVVINSKPVEIAPMGMRREPRWE